MSSIYRLKILIYAVGELLNKFSSFMFLPVMALLISKQEFGVLSVIYPLILLLPGVLTLGQSISSLKYLTKDNTDQGLVLFHAFFLCLLFNLIVGLGFLFFADTWSDIIFGSYLLVDLAPTAFLIAVILSFLLIFNQHAQANGLANVFVLFNTAPKLSFVTSVLAISIFFDLNTLIILNTYLLILLIFAIYAILRINRLLVFEIYCDQIKNMLLVGSPIAISALALIFNSFASRSFLNSMGGMDNVADYSFMLVMSQSCLIFFTTFSRIFIPKLFKMLNADNDHSVFFQRTNNFLLIGSFSIVVAVYLLVINLAPTYYPEYELDPLFFGLMAASNFPYILYITMVDTISFKKRGKALVILNIVLGSFTTFVSYYAVNALGLFGAVITYFSAAWLQGLMISFVCRDIFFVSINIVSVIFVNLFFLCLVLFFKFFPEFSIEASIVIIVALLIFLFFNRSYVMNYLRLF